MKKLIAYGFKRNKKNGHLEKFDRLGSVNWMRITVLCWGKLGAETSVHFARKRNSDVWEGTGIPLLMTPAKIIRLHKSLMP